MPSSAKVLLAVVTASITGLHAQTTTVPVTFKTGARMVLVPIAVTNHNGKALTGLRAENFTILEDGKPQNIVAFANDDAPCSVGLVLDISGSMRNIFNIAKDVARTFFRTANPDDEVRLLTVSTRPDAVSEFTTDMASVEKNVEYTQSGGMTALIDTVYLGLSRMRQAKWPRRALLIISDGMDNYSRYSKAELMRVALEADVQVYTVVVDNPSASVSSGIPMRPSMVAKPWDQAAQRQGRDLLEELSNKTGGLHFHVRSGDEANAAARKAADVLRNEYVIGFQPQNSLADGKWHRIRVKSNVPDSHINARNGYYSQ